jgi:hypothetical protein
MRIQNPINLHAPQVNTNRPQHNIIIHNPYPTNNPKNEKKSVLDDLYTIICVSPYFEMFEKSGAIYNGLVTISGLPIDKDWHQ